MTGVERGLALLVAVVWGLNFPAMALVLDHYPPLLGAAIRFALIAVPTLLLVPHPQVRLIWLLGTGLCVGFLQFAFLFAGFRAGMPAGLASLMLQSAAPFTMLLARILLRERLSPRAAGGVALAMAGLAVIGAARAQAVSSWPVILTLLAALSWAAGNICIRLARAPDPLRLSLWMTVIPPLPLFALSLLTERDRAVFALTGALSPGAPTANLALLFSAFVASVIGYGIWSRLLSRHPTHEVVPWAMLVPFFGLLSAWALLGEIPRRAELAGGALIVAGVLVANGRARRAPDPLPVTDNPTG